MSESSLLIQEPENDLATSTTPTPPTTTTTIGVVEESIASDSLPAAEDSLLIHGSHDDDDDNDIDEPPWNGQDSSASAAAAEEEASSSSRPLRILFLSDVTGGGHLASAEALGKQVRGREEKRHAFLPTNMHSLHSYLLYTPIHIVLDSVSWKYCGNLQFVDRSRRSCVSWNCPILQAHVGASLAMATVLSRLQYQSCRTHWKESLQNVLRTECQGTDIRISTRCRH